MGKRSRLSLADRAALGSSALASQPIAYLARRFKCTPDTVRRWRNRGSSGAAVGLDAQRSGRPRKLDAAAVRSSKRAAKNGATAATIAARISRNRAIEVSASTVRRALKGGRRPLEYRVVQRGRVLSAANKVKRAAFCETHAGAHTRTWLYVDSKLFFLFRNAAGQLRCRWQTKGEKVVVPRGSNPTVLHCYGAVGTGFKSNLLFVNPTPPAGTKQKKGESFDSPVFISEVLPWMVDAARRFRGGGRCAVVLDNAKPHTSKTSQAAIADSGMRMVEGFPTQSFDINIIECVWAQLTNGLEHRRPATFDGWKRVIAEVWDGIHQGTIDKLVDGVRGRMQQIAEGGGAWLFAYKQR